MRKAIVVFTFLILLIITGCSNKDVSNHNYTYKGENELWSAEYSITGTGSPTNHSLFLTF